MLDSTTGRLLPLLSLALLLPLATPAPAAAQEDGEEDGPPDRVVSVLHMEIPFTDRNVVFPFMRQYFLPQGQLNPNVITQRVMWHYYGQDARDVYIVTEYENLAAIEAPCGQPCEDWEAENGPPEEGEEGYEEYQEAQALFQKYFAEHGDELLFAPGAVAKIEGEMHGPVGMPEEDEEEGME